MISSSTRFQTNLRELREAVRIHPQDAAAAYALGLCLSKLKNQSEALQHLTRAVRLEPSSPRFLNSLAHILITVGEYEEGKRWLERAIVLDPMNAEAHLHLGDLYADRMGQFVDAIPMYQQVIRLAPHNVSGYTGLGKSILGGWGLTEAFSSFLKKLPPNANSDLANDGFSLALAHHGKYGEAKEFLETLLKTGSYNAAAYLHLGNVALIAARDVQSAIRYHEKALELNPSFLPAIGSYIGDFLLLGDYERARVEFHQKKSLFPRKLFEHPTWEGESLKDKTIVLGGNNGYGDTLQFARFASMAKEQGAVVVIKSHWSLRSLLATIPIVDSVLTWEDDGPGADYECDIEELSNYCDINLNEVGKFTPYLFPPERVRQEWLTRLPAGDSLKVGVVWRGGQIWVCDPYRNRSIPLATLQPLSKLEKVKLFSLQKFPQWDLWPGENPRYGDLPESPPPFELTDLSSWIQDFMDTAGAILALDLIITVDTSVAHLAGALGKPTWLLLPFASSWQWLLDREDSPWYPSMRLFRQPRPGDWANVVSNLTTALGIYAAEHRTI